MSPNDADGMANSVDPGQTAPLGAVWSGSALFAQAYLSEDLGSLRYSRHGYIEFISCSEFWKSAYLCTELSIKEYGKIPKNLDTRKIAVIIIKF